jgi:hypothetical protein
MCKIIVFIIILCGLNTDYYLCKRIDFFFIIFARVILMPNISKRIFLI